MWRRRDVDDSSAFLAKTPFSTPEGRHDRHSRPASRRGRARPLSLAAARFGLLILGLVAIDALLFLTRRTYFLSGRQAHLSVLQRMLYFPGRDGTYAQNFQDTWVLRLAAANGWLQQSGYKGKRGELPEEARGARLFFLDIGAYSGIWCSNTRLLEMDESGGWYGACVEPFPADFADRSCQLFVNAMASIDGDTVTFDGHDQERRVRNSAGTDNMVQPSGSSRGPGIGAASTISFPTLLRESNAPKFIHFISLDIEGQELDALRVFPFDSYTVGAWIVENGVGKVAQLLESEGYKQRPVQNRGVDTYFVKDDYWFDYLLEKEWRTHPFASWGC